MQSEQNSLAGKGEPAGLPQHTHSTGLLLCKKCSHSSSVDCYVQTAGRFTPVLTESNTAHSEQPSKQCKIIPSEFNVPQIDNC